MQIIILFDMQKGVQRHKNQIQSSLQIVKEENDVFCQQKEAQSKAAPIIPMLSTSSPLKAAIKNYKILPLNKKTSLTSEAVEFQSQRAYQIQETLKNKRIFSTFIDNVIKNRFLCRRGPFEAPFPPSSPVPRTKRFKTEGGFLEANYISRGKGQLQTDRKPLRSKLSWAKLKEIEQKQKRQLPPLSNNRDQPSKQMPIRVKKFMSKAVNRGYTQSPEQLDRQRKNILLRKLDVELINFEWMARAANYQTLA